MRASCDRNGGGRVALSAAAEPGRPLDFSKKQTLTFWLRFRNANTFGFGGPSPVVSLRSGKASIRYIPLAAGAPASLLSNLPYPEAREGWLRVAVDLAGSAQWHRAEAFDGAPPQSYQSGLLFETVSTPIETQRYSSLAAAGDTLFCAAADGDRLIRSDDGGRSWREVQSVASLGGEPGGWGSGMLAFDARRGAQGTLYLRHVPGTPKTGGGSRAALAAYDISKNAWSAAPSRISITHGAAVAGRYLYGFARSRMGDYGGGFCRVSLDPYKKDEDRTMLDFTNIPDRDWYGAPAQLLTIGGAIYGIKNDWATPQPKDKDKIGDRLFVFNPRDFKPSSFAGTDADLPQGWKEARSAVSDLGPLPFEPGRGAALAALPPRWCEEAGGKGGIFILAGCSPSDHEGAGAPSKLFAIYDIESGTFTTGELPGETGEGSSAAFCNNKLYIKRGGAGAAAANRELWFVTPVATHQRAALEAARERMRADMSKIDAVGIELESPGPSPWTVWIDGFRAD